jgi:uncharacterized protein (TIGR02646 family)
MKYIKKTQEPKTLTQHRANTNASYDNCPTATKDDIRKALLAEQGDICCYCQQRINVTNPARIGDDMKIEHFKPQNIYNGTNGMPDLTLDYQNMLGACLGVLNQDTHCDTHKGGVEMALSPLNPRCEKLIKYRKSNGEIYSDDAAVNQELNQVLNLNLQTLRDNRKEVLVKLVKFLNNKSRGVWTRPLLEQTIQKYKQRNRKNKYAPFCQMVVFYLEKKLKNY